MLEGIHLRSYTRANTHSPDEITIDSLFGFPTPNGKFSIYVSKIIVELFGEFLSCLESKFKGLEKDSSLDHVMCTSRVYRLKGRYALIWFPSKDPEKGSLIFDDDLGRYLYGM